MQPNLPIAWIDRIFNHLSGLYGSKFTDMWRETDIAEVKLLWAEKLAGFKGRPEAIKSAMDALDDKPWPPTLPEFLHLCRDAARRAGPLVPALEHKLSPEDIERNKARAREMAEKLGRRMVA